MNFLDWVKSLWVYVDYTTDGTFVYSGPKNGSHKGLTHSYWLVPGTETY